MLTSSFIIQSSANVGIGTNAVLSKLHLYDNNSIYICKIYGMTDKISKYIICIVNLDIYNIGHLQYMKDLFWIALQTRILDSNFISNILD